MSPDLESYFSVFMLFGASVAAISIFLLLKDKNRPFANNMLALLAASWGFSCYWFFAFIQEAPFYSLSLTTFIGPMIPLTLFPPIYLYVKYLFHDFKKFNSTDHVHFLPIYIYSVFTLYLFASGNFTIDQMRAHPWFLSRSMLSSYIGSLQGIVYFFLASNMLKKWQDKLKQEYSDIEHRKLKWLRNINICLLPVFLIGVLSTIIRSTHLNPYILYMAYHAVMCLGLVYIHFTIFKKPLLFSIESEPVVYQEAPVVAVSQSSKAKQASFSDNGKHQAIVEKLQEVMSKEKLFKNPNINLNELTLAIGETRNSLSYVLNNYIKKSFYDYINEFRIEESKKLLCDKNFNSYKIEAISHEAGFKSVSVFYRLFKNAEKITPTEFRNQNIGLKSY